MLDHDGGQEASVFAPTSWVQIPLKSIFFSKIVVENNVKTGCTFNRIDVYVYN